LNLDASPAARAAFRRRLLTWFDRHRRDLPWRASRDPYRIWVSEVMLQQTTVAAVVPYFTRFLAAFPTIEALAAADEQDVLKLWAGLGYYRRARHLHAAARQLVAAHGGTLPDDESVWHELPGVGRYILGAVLSQAFDRRLPIVEANSLRVLARLFGYRGDPREGDGKPWVWSAAESLLPVKRCGDFNQALMELGALICTPSAPRCDQCPVAKFCRARHDGSQSRIPPPKRANVILDVREVGLVIRNRGRVLLCRRPPDAARWQNMWEVPHAEIPTSADPAIEVHRTAKTLTGLAIAMEGELTVLQHTVTRHAITVTCFEATRRRGRFRSDFYTEGRWLLPAELGDYPVSSPQRRLIELIRRPPPQKKLF
jgi:A/G-specific adenine glycosylase